MNRIFPEPSTNGTVPHQAKPVRKGKASIPANRKAPGKTARERKPVKATIGPSVASAPQKANHKRVLAFRKGRQHIALAVGAVACFVLLLSVWHCTEALHLLTGSPVILAAMLAIGVDVGMVACEVASVVGDGEARKWADRYIIVAVVLSSGLNAFASAQHATQLVWLAVVVGAIIPALVFMLAKVSSHLYKD